MTWNVFRENFNGKQIETLNIFKHSNFANEVNKLLAEHTSKETFAEDLKLTLMYYFWCKCEHECVITSWPPYISKDELNRINAEYAAYYSKYGHDPFVINISPTVGKKVDIYSQVMLNWDVFVDYVWNYKRKENEL